NAGKDQPFFRGQHRDQCWLKVPLVTGDLMINGNRLSTGELNTILKVGQIRRQSGIDDLLGEKDKTKAPHSVLRVATGLPIIGDSQSKEIEKRAGQRRRPAFDLWRLADQIQYAQTAFPVGPLRHHVNEDIDVHQDLHLRHLREICSRISTLSSST